jgi:hypothetical protein
MNPRILVFSLLCSAISTTAFGQSETAQSCPADGQNGPVMLHETWILDGWERAPGDPAFVFAEKLARYYDLEGPGVFYDDLAPDGKTARRAIDYGALWEGPFNNMRSAHHAISDGPDAIIGNSVASTTLEFVARLEARDGAVTAIRDRSQLGWQCDGNRWVIRHEHNSARVVTEAEIAPYFQQTEEQSGMSEIQPSPYIGMWVTADNHVRQELRPDGRYAEARGNRENAYTGRYEIEGNRIEYWDDSGFTADGEFIDGILHHGGMIMHRQENNQ